MFAQTEDVSKLREMEVLGIQDPHLKKKLRVGDGGSGIFSQHCTCEQCGSV